MPSAEIIAIGTELLLGENQDTNTRFIARQLRDIGVDLYRTTIVGDNLKRIENIIREALTRTNIIITTGGLGPTVDDPTRQAAAAAFEVDLEYREDMWRDIQAHFQRMNWTASENNKRQAYMPAGAIPVENPVGTAPAFICIAGEHILFSLPGVPREMEHLMHTRVIPFLKDHFDLTGTIKARVLHTAGIGESSVDALVGDLETCTNPTVGLLAHPGNTDVRITAKSESLEEADQMIAEMEAKVRERLGDHIFGVDDETLESVIMKYLVSRGLSLVTAEFGLEGRLASRLRSAGMTKANSTIAENPQIHDTLVQLINQQGADFALGAVLESLERGTQISIILLTPEQEFTKTRKFLGTSSLAAKWAANSALDMLRRHLIKSN